MRCSRERAVSWQGMIIRQVAEGPFFAAAAAIVTVVINVVSVW